MKYYDTLIKVQKVVNNIADDQINHSEGQRYMCEKVLRRFAKTIPREKREIVQEIRKLLKRIGINYLEFKDFRDDNRPPPSMHH